MTKAEKKKLYIGLGALAAVGAAYYFMKHSNSTAAKKMQAAVTKVSTTVSGTVSGTPAASTATVKAAYIKGLSDDPSTLAKLYLENQGLQADAGNIADTVENYSSDELKKMIADQAYPS